MTRWILGAVGILVVGVMGFGSGVWVGLATPAGTINRPTDVVIPNGSGTIEIAAELTRSGVVAHPQIWRAWVRLTHQDRHLMAGTFRFLPTDTVIDITNRLTGKYPGQCLISVTIPEGYTLNRIAWLLEKKGVCSRTEFNHYGHVAKNELTPEFPELATIPTSSLEGLFFPDTYRFAKGVPVAMVYRAGLRQFFRVTAPIFNTSQSPDLPKLGRYNLLILASIIEKEARFQSDMPLIASVFYNRLRTGMPLQSCPTVAFAIGTPDKLILTGHDLRTQNPFNTYIYPGLPPTPISNPGRAAIRAAMAPATTSYRYFVAKPDGHHQFSENYTSHLAGARAWYRYRASIGR